MGSRVQEEDGLGGSVDGGADDSAEARFVTFGAVAGGGFVVGDGPLVAAD